MNADMKLFELRDEGTLIPWLAFRFTYPMRIVERRLLRRAGYGDEPESSECVIQGPAHCSGENSFERLAYNNSWIKSPRLRMAAIWIHDNFEDLESGQVIDIRVILGEATKPVRSEYAP